MSNTKVQVEPADDTEVRELASAPEAGVLTAISRAELDHQITTARAYPRSLKKFVSECLSMVTLNEQVAEDCLYAVPRGGKVIEGPSIRMAEIVTCAWGNCRAGARIIDEGPEFVTAQGVFHDMERNVQITMEVRRRITGKDGRRYNADMIGNTGNAACSIAVRNAIFRGIPKALWSGIYEEAKKAALGTAQTLVSKRDKMLAHMQKLGVGPEAVFARVGVQGVEDLGVEQINVLRGLANAIKEGESTVEEAFPAMTAPKPAASGKAKKGVEGLAQRMGSKAATPPAGSAPQGEPVDYTEVPFDEPQGGAS